MLSLEVTLQFPAIGAEAEHHIEGPFAFSIACMRASPLSVRLFRNALEFLFKIRNILPLS